MEKPTLDKILNGMKNQKYVIFKGEKGKTHDLNIFGVRTTPKLAGKFDDWLGVFWYDHEKSDWEFRVWTGTTDPGIYYLKKPMNKRGTAILKEGQHLKSHKIGKHAGKYRALRQHSVLPVYRDDNRDTNLNLDPETLHLGKHCINIHRAHRTKELAYNYKWSAGCQVFQNPDDFDDFIDIINEAEDNWGDKFTYTLLTEEQLA